MKWMKSSFTLFISMNWSQILDHLSLKKIPGFALWTCLRTAKPSWGGENRTNFLKIAPKSPLDISACFWNLRPWKTRFKRISTSVISIWRIIGCNSTKILLQRPLHANNLHLSRLRYRLNSTHPGAWKLIPARKLYWKLASLHLRQNPRNILLHQATLRWSPKSLQNSRKKDPLPLKSFRYVSKKQKCKCRHLIQNCPISSDEEKSLLLRD